MNLRVNAAHTYAVRGDDCYPTPPEATRALLKIERLPKSVADPCCGAWAILDVLKDDGHIVHGSDIRDFRPGYTVIRDYLFGPVEMNGVGIVTNPRTGLPRPSLGRRLRMGATTMRGSFARISWNPCSECRYGATTRRAGFGFPAVACQ